MKYVVFIFTLIIFYISALSCEPWLSSVSVYWQFLEGEPVLQGFVSRMRNAQGLIEQEICSRVSAVGILEPYFAISYEYEESLLIRQRFRVIKDELGRTDTNGEIVFSYNDRNQLIKETVIRTSGESAFSDNTYYTYKEHLLEKKSNFISTEEYYYDEENELILSRIVFDDVLIESKYTNGVLAEKIRTVNDGDVHADVRLTKYEYENEYLVRASEYCVTGSDNFYGDSENLCAYRNYKYNGRGLLECIESYAVIRNEDRTKEQVLLQSETYLYSASGLLQETCVAAGSTLAEDNLYSVITRYIYSDE